MKYHKGNQIVVIIISAVALVLVGTIGFLFWRNITSDKSNTSQSPKVEATKNVEDSIGIGVSFMIPENWTSASKVTTVESSGATREYINVQSHNEKGENGTVNVFYFFEKASKGLSGTCDLTSRPENKISFIQKQDLSNFKNSTLMEYKTQDSGKLSSWGSRLFATEAVANVKIGSHQCDIFQKNAITFNNNDSNILIMGDIQIKDREVPNTNSASTPINLNFTDSDLDQSLQSADYIKAKNVLLSTRYNS